jgi:hypothetical protein
MVFSVMAQGDVNIASQNNINISAYSGMDVMAGRLDILSAYIDIRTPTSPPQAPFCVNVYSRRVNLLDPSTGGTTTNNGDLTVQGHIRTNSARVLNNLQVLTINSLAPKAFIHPHPTNTSEVIRYVAMESGEALTVARGVARTENGQVTISLPEHFALVTSNTEPIAVILTPEGAPVLLYTKQKSREKIVVAMRPSDFSEYKDVEFSYQITGTRDGFEDLEIIIDEEKLDAGFTAADFEKNDVTKRIKAHIERDRERQGLKINHVEE